jgi:hypothetical protein
MWRIDKRGQFNGLSQIISIFYSLRKIGSFIFIKINGNISSKFPLSELINKKCSRGAVDMW